VWICTRGARHRAPPHGTLRSVLIDPFPNVPRAERNLLGTTFPKGLGNRFLDNLMNVTVEIPVKCGGFHNLRTTQIRGGWRRFSIRQTSEAFPSSSAKIEASPGPTGDGTGPRDTTTGSRPTKTIPASATSLSTRSRRSTSGFSCNKPAYMCRCAA